LPTPGKDSFISLSGHLWRIERKDDGFYLIPLPRRSEGSWMTLSYSDSVFFFFEITVFIMTMVTPRCTGDLILRFSNLFVNKCTALHTWTLALL
jgi:hypothetical protein